MTRHQLTDSMSTSNGQTPSTMEPGHNTIDHAMAPLKIMRAINKAEHVPFRYEIEADHRAIVIYLDLNLLFHETEERKN